MSLLLDARKKSQDAQASQEKEVSRSGVELSLDEHPNASAKPSMDAPTPPSYHAPLPAEKARSAGQNLFNAKSSGTSHSFSGINRNLLFALGGTVLLLAMGGGYVWYATSVDSTPPMRPVTRPPLPPVVQQPAAETAPQLAQAPEAAPSKPAGTLRPKRNARPKARAALKKTQRTTPLRVEKYQQKSIDPLLNSAYSAYREGKLDQSQQLYRDALKLDKRNTDALLGLAVIAQKQGKDNTAAHYYAKVLELNPRDPVANAGMSALATDENRESRLKFLLNQQQDSASLHFALGNHYASQERWGEAQQSYFNAYTLDQKSALLAFNLAVSLERIGQGKLAARYYQSALQLDPSHSEGFDHTQISKRIEELTR